MNKYIRTTLIFIGVWFIAALINGILCGISIAFFDYHNANTVLGNFGLAVIFSFVFAVPLTGFVWLVTIIAQADEKKGDELFQLVLQATLFCATAGAIFFICTIGREFMNTRYVAGLSIIFSAMASVLFFRKQIKTNG